MSYEQTREILEMHLASVRELENMTDKHEHQTAEALHQTADEMTEELTEFPERFTDAERRTYWREIDELRAAASWVAAEIPDHDGTTTYAESYLRDVLDIEIHGRYDRDAHRWEATEAHALISFGGPTVWITGPHGPGGQYVEVIATYGETHTARTYAPNLAEYLEGLAEIYNYAGTPR